MPVKTRRDDHDSPWDGLTFRTTTEGKDNRHVVLEALRGDARRWRCRIDATGGDPDLYGRAEQPILLGDVLLLKTDGEHYRGATSHERQLHLIDPHGRLRWSKDITLLAHPVDPGGDHLLLIRDLIGRYARRFELALAEALWVRKRNGREDYRWPLTLDDIPDDVRHGKNGEPFVETKLRHNGTIKVIVGWRSYVGNERREATSAYDLDLLAV